MTRRPLAWRLGLVMGIAVLGVLLVVGVVVNRVVSQGFQSVVTAQQEQRLDDAAVTLADRFDRPARVSAIVRRLALNLGGEVKVVATGDTTLAAFGNAPERDVATYVAPIVVDGATVATLQATLPGSGTDRGFLPLFNLTLVVAGIASLIVIVLISTVLAGRLTRPLRDVAAAARQLEAGETDARATGGDDRESAELAAAFNAMADRLERSEMLRRRAASDVAHDLATPATVLESQLQAMIDGVVPTDPGESRGRPLRRRLARGARRRAGRSRERRGGAAPGSPAAGRYRAPRSPRRSSRSMGWRASATSASSARSPSG